MSRYVIMSAGVAVGIAAGFVLGRFFWAEEPDVSLQEGHPPPLEHEGAEAVAIANTVIRVSSPEPGATVTSPLTVTGEARTFEANVQIRVRDDRGIELAHTFTTAATPDVGVFGPFSASVRYREPTTTAGLVEVFESSAKDGSEINMIQIPVVFAAQEWIPVNIHFTPIIPEHDCGETRAVTRWIATTPAVGRAALEELLLGPTADEATSFRVSTAIPFGVTLRSLVIRDGVAYADFDRTIETGGSCRVSAIRAQITQTLREFPTVRDVVIAGEGNSEEALQP